MDRFAMGYADGMSVALRKESHVGWIDTLDVHPEFPGKDFGKIVLKYAIQTFASVECKAIFLNVFDANVVANQ